VRPGGATCVGITSIRHELLVNTGTPSDWCSISISRTSYTPSCPARAFLLQGSEAWR
jgi:hypothetical protein